MKMCAVTFRQEGYKRRPCKFTMIERVNGVVKSVRCTNCGKRQP